MYKARKVVENTFGILVQKWRIFLDQFQLVETTVLIVRTTYILHSFLRTKRSCSKNYNVAVHTSFGRTYGNNPFLDRWKLIQNEQQIVSFSIRETFASFHSVNNKIIWYVTECLGLVSILSHAIFFPYIFVFFMW